MKRLVSLIILFTLSFNLNAQEITGIWRGYFMSGQGLYRQKYKYEIQIEQLENNALNGVTYSYRTTIFYGKATMRGIYMKTAKNILIQELKLVELKIADKSEPCVMTCYLDYAREGDLEILEGTFTSVNANTKADCGAGTVYLEKVPESDFQKEDFLVKYENKKKEDELAAKKKAVTPKSKKPAASATLAGKSKPKTTQKPVAKAGSNTSTPKKPPVAKSKTTPKKQSTTPPAGLAKKDTAAPLVIVPEQKQPEPEELPKPKIKVPVPAIIKERENTLVKTIATTSGNIKIQLYDNGEIDGDTITVYHNNEVVAYKKGLSYQPVTLNIKATVDDPVHEFIMVADNLGKIPPNTALMVITTGGKRYELFITSTEQKNAKVVIQFKVPGSDT
ncbi:hypothetical protein [Foetidibacter luteolus]|uniref:hypothetical protein n=1 Tax=Foetidibacter luteolus TaxID=2608880 RepID=UPI00129A22F8|nr:hypothetical protein [Foetidibacter luteolus]